MKADAAHGPRAALGVACVIGLAAGSACSTRFAPDELRRDPPSASATVPSPTEQAASFAPTFGPTVTQAKAPPPISGGTMTVGPDGNLVAMADPDRDLVYLVDVDQRAVLHTIELPEGSEPGRVAFDDQGRVHVALRGTGELVTIQAASGLFALRTACKTAARGVAFEKSTNEVHIACTDGSLVSFSPVASADTKEPTRTRHFGADLRDVFVSKSGSMYITHFRNAAIERVFDGVVSSALVTTGGSVGYRAIAAPAPRGDGGDEPIMVSQEPLPPPPVPLPSEYYAAPSGLRNCPVDSPSTVDASVSVVVTRLSSRTGSVIVPRAVVPVDVASNGRQHVVVAAGNAFAKGLHQLLIVQENMLLDGHQDCVPLAEGNVDGQAIAAAFTSRDELLVQTREPAALHIMTKDLSRAAKTIPLSTISRKDTGHDIFHATAGRMLACATCHAEGGDDGHTWSFGDIGPRRTPSLLGTMKNTAPFHWDGSVANVQGLTDGTFRERMAGPYLADYQVKALEHYMFDLPAPKPLRPAADLAAARGKTAFESRCTSCHQGAMLTNNASMNVGTDGKFQVPSLVGVAWRGPWVHDGCAATLANVLDPACGGSRHASAISGLSSATKSDLFAYLESL